YSSLCSFPYSSCTSFYSYNLNCYYAYTRDLNSYYAYTLSSFAYSPLYAVYTSLTAEKRDTRSYREKRVSNAYAQTPTCLRSLANIRAIRYFYCSILLRSSYTSLSVEAAAKCSKRATTLRRRLLVYLSRCYP